MRSSLWSFEFPPPNQDAIMDAIKTPVVVQLKAAASYAWIAFMVVLVAVAIIALAMMGSRGMEAARKLWAWVWLKKTEGQIKRLGQVKAANDFAGDVLITQKVLAEAFFWSYRHGIA